MLRREIDQTVDAFYVAEVADLALAMAQETVESLSELERSAKTRAKEDDKAKVEVGRVRLEVLDAQRALRRAVGRGRYDQNAIANTHRPLVCDS